MVESSGSPARGARPGAHDLAAAFASGDLSPVEATEAALAAIDAHDGRVSAMVLVDPDGARGAAAESAARWENGRPLGPVDGVPVTIKDNLLTRGWPTRRGSTLVDPAGPWTEDSPAVARLRESGAVVLGKTTTPELAWKAVTDSALSGSTGNPWDEGLTSGGSSGGSAAAVGLGMGAWSVGTDGGGSVRIPAAFTGTVALKATFGLVPIYPPSPFGTLSHAGPMTTSVLDAALMMDVLTGPDPRDWFATGRPVGPFVDGLDGGVRGLRVAFSPTLGGAGENDPEVEALVRGAVDALADLGARVVEADPPARGLRQPFETLWFTGAAKAVEALGPGAFDRVDPLLAEHARRYSTATAADYLDAMAARMAFGAAMGVFHETHDVLVTPTMPIVAFERGRDAPIDWPEDLWTSWCPYTYPFNLTGQPALSVPCGLTSDGRPVGLQVVGARHADGLVLRTGRALELAGSLLQDLPPLLR